MIFQTSITFQLPRFFDAVYFNELYSTDNNTSVKPIAAEIY